MGMKYFLMHGKSSKWYLETLKSVQNKVQTATWNHQIHEKVTKRWNLMKTFIFTILLIGWDIRNHKMFCSKLIKNHACTPNMLFDASHHRIYQKVIQNGLQRGTQNPLKILQNPDWDLPGSLCVHLWPTRLQNGAKMLPKDLQMDPKWSPGNPKRN